MRLFLARHPQTAWNALGRAQGHTDIELDEVGCEQAERLADAMKGQGITAIFSSDLKRSSACAERVAEGTGADLILDPRLRERRMGEWEGLDYGEWNRRFRLAALPHDPFMLEIAPPGGESLREVWTRIQPITEALMASEAPSLVVTHGGTGSLLLAQLMRANIESAKSFRFANAGLTELCRRPDGLFNLVRYNDTTHLDGHAILSGSLDGIAR